MNKVNNRSFRKILRALGELPGLTFYLSPELDSHGHRVIRIASKDDEKFFLELSIVKARDGWPSEVQQVLANIPKPWPRNLLVAARSFSPGALEKLRKRDANWVDEAGNIRIHVPPRLIVLKEAKKLPKPNPRFSWSLSSSSLAEFLLCNKDQKFKLQEIAATLRWSVPQVSNVFRVFENSGWIVRHGPARGAGVWWELRNPAVLLDAWSTHMSSLTRKKVIGHRLMPNPISFLLNELVPLLNGLGEWAVTGWAGLEMIAPFINIVPSLQVYLPSDIFHQGVDQVFAKAQINEIEQGGNIELWEMETPLIHASRADSESVINLPRLYSDLLSMGGRAKEGAEHLRETEIAY